MSETSPVLEGLVVGDAPDAWRAAGFEVSGDLVTAGGVALRLAGDEGARGVLRWTLSPPAPGAVDGLEHTDAGGPSPAATTSHPNGVVGLDHVVVTSDDPARTTSALGTLGLVPRRTVTGIRGDGDDELTYRFFLLGTCVLELVGPTTPAGDGPARFDGLAFTSDRVDDLGDLTGPARDAVQPGRRIATLRGRDLGISVPVAFLSPRPPKGT